MSAATRAAFDLVAVPVRSDADAIRLIGILDEVWGGAPGSSHLDHGMVTALAHAGEYTMIFESEGRAVGAAVGFFGPPRSATLHSHILGVLPQFAGSGAGLAVKQHQRSWCLERGVTSITWTFDPLIGRNAAFNLRKLGTRVEGYLEDFYGNMTDSVNAGQATDRVLLRWDLETPSFSLADGEQASEWLVEDEFGDPLVVALTPGAPRLSIRVPRDIERLRRESPERARRWRTALRGTLGAALSNGWTVIAFAPGGEYIVERKAG